VIASDNAAMTAYDTSNVFARILRGELPSQTVYEDDETIAIMDIMPRADGHVLVIPKAACRNVLDGTTLDRLDLTSACPENAFHFSGRCS